jgi:hypothetical protein
VTVQFQSTTAGTPVAAVLSPQVSIFRLP